MEINGKPAVRIFAKEKHNTGKATLFDCEGDDKWIPNSQYEDLKDGTIKLAKWLYDKNFDDHPGPVSESEAYKIDVEQKPAKAVRPFAEDLEDTEEIENETDEEKGDETCPPF